MGVSRVSRVGLQLVQPRIPWTVHGVLGAWELAQGVMRDADGVVG